MSEGLTAVRTLDVVEMELRVLQEQTQRVVLSYAIEAGRRLEEAKAMLEHGQWLPWVRKMGYSQSTANDLMRVFREYGKAQQNLFGGEVNSQAFENLEYSKLVQLLAIEDPAEREDFVQHNQVAEMSTRELKKAIQEKKEAERRAEQAEADAKAAEDARKKMEQDMEFTKAVMAGQQKSANAYKNEADKLREELRELKNRPIEVAVETREPSGQELEALTAAAVEQARSSDAQRIREMEKQLAAADPNTAAFKVLFKNWQEIYRKMMDALELVEAVDGEKARKLRRAVQAAAAGMR